MTEEPLESLESSPETSIACLGDQRELQDVEYALRRIRVLCRNDSAVDLGQNAVDVRSPTAKAKVERGFKRLTELALLPPEELSVHTREQLSNLAHLP